uniref:Uncharacterized protein n=1 Tax=Kalanchoe fedtschenkoi TaxID=63787 RepID=A0A7N0RG30_KALFE
MDAILCFEELSLNTCCYLFGFRGHEGPTIILFFLSIPTFLLAEFLNLSGTLSVFFYAITTTHYLWPTVTENSII